VLRLTVVQNRVGSVDRALGVDVAAVGGFQCWAERAYPQNLIYFNELDRGGHFAAWEQPDLFSAEMRAAF